MPFYPDRPALFICRLAMATALLLPSFAAGAEKPSASFAPFSKRDYTPAALGPREPELKVDFPGSAMMRGVGAGRATVAVQVDERGKPIDFLVVSHTYPAFGDALLDHVRTLSYQPARWKKQPIPSRVDIAYQFEVPTVVSVIDSSLRLSESVTGVKPAFQALTEKHLDRELEFTHAVLPLLPEEFSPPDEKPVRVFVTFFIDEQGRVRIPNVESAAHGALIPHAVRAVQQWTFKPPTAKGAPVLVFVGRPVRFLPRTP
jgi:TonB family protein